MINRYTLPHTILMVGCKITDGFKDIKVKKTHLTVLIVTQIVLASVFMKETYHHGFMQNIIMTASALIYSQLGK